MPSTLKDIVRQVSMEVIEIIWDESIVKSRLRVKDLRLLTFYTCSIVSKWSVNEICHCQSIQGNIMVGRGGCKGKGGWQQGKGRQQGRGWMRGEFCRVTRMKGALRHNGWGVDKEGQDGWQGSSTGQWVLRWWRHNGWKGWTKREGVDDDGRDEWKQCWDH